jgi:uncharacterized membrane protein
MNDAKGNPMGSAADRGMTAMTGALVAAALFAQSTAAIAAPSQPWVEVVADSRGAAGVVRAGVDIAAPPVAVWRVMIDCAQVPRLMANVKSCRVLQHDPAGRWDVREQISKGSILPGVRTVLRSDYDAPRLVRFHRIDGDFKVLEGEWRLEPLDGGARTRVTYESRMTAPFAAPGIIVRAVLRHDMPLTLANLRDASVAAEAIEMRAERVVRP